MKRVIIFTIAVAFTLSLFTAIPRKEAPTVIVKDILKGQDKGQIIDAYFSARKMPLAGYGKKLVVEAEKNGLDWRLLPAIAVRESSGGLHACGKNFWGWGSCRLSDFSSIDKAIEIVAKNLGGNATNTSHFYKDKTIRQKLEAYNPPSVLETYPDEVTAIMDGIGSP